MIDIENQLYSKLTDKLIANFPNVQTSSTFTITPSHFPFVSIEQIENSINQDASDMCNLENAVNVAFEINIYTKDPNKKIVAKDISQTIDNFMSGLGFARLSNVPLQDADGVAYRINLRYEGVIDKSLIVYRR